MKELRITIEISHEGRVSADAEGFSGDACIKELERLLEGLGPGTATLERKADDKTATRTTNKTQNMGRKP
jgi:hypothetical protein